MKFRIDIHPINTVLLDKLGIKHTSLLKDNRKYSGILTKLIKAGYTEIQTSYLPEYDEVRTHVTMKRDENSNYYK